MDRTARTLVDSGPAREMEVRRMTDQVTFTAFELPFQVPVSETGTSVSVSVSTFAASVLSGT